MGDILEKPRTTYSYNGFVELCEALLAENKTTGENHSVAYLDYTRINLQRTHRIYKTTEINADLSAAIANLKGKYKALILVEAWCGDVGQNLPVIAKALEGSPNFVFEAILRDENLDVIDQFLTNGGRAIPKLIVTDLATNEVRATWGPRPAAAQQMVHDWKVAIEKPPYSEFIISLQLWYTHDKTQSLQAELLTMVNGLESDAE